MKKGVLPAIAIAAIVMFAVSLIWGIVIHWAIGENENVVRSVREREITKLINDMEWNKRVMPYVLEYSFYQSSYSITSKGGYYNPNQVPSFDCIPYWKVYERTYIPQNLEYEMNESLIMYMSAYTSSLGINLPQYDIDYEYNGNDISVYIMSSENLEIERGIAKVEDESDFEGKYNVNIFDLFEKGVEFANSDAVSSAILNVADECDEIKDAISTEIKGIETDEIKMDVVDTISDCNGNVAAKILVTIDGQGEHNVYDYFENSTSMRNIQLKFYIISGNLELLSPETNSCEY